jgi:trehalose-6-phosphate synthase
MVESTAAELLERALSLPREDRLALGKELVRSVVRDDEQQWADAWLEELDDRAEAAERGEDEPPESWEDIEARFLAELRSR